jgi:hypothetical protein
MSPSSWSEPVLDNTVCQAHVVGNLLTCPAHSVSMETSHSSPNYGACDYNLAMISWKFYQVKCSSPKFESFESIEECYNREDSQHHLEDSLLVVIGFTFFIFTLDCHLETNETNIYSLFHHRKILPSIYTLEMWHSSTGGGGDEIVVLPLFLIVMITLGENIEMTDLNQWAPHEEPHSHWSKCICTCGVQQVGTTTILKSELPKFSI